VDEDDVQLDRLFPIELLGMRAQQSLLEEFGRRHPSISEVARIADTHLSKLPGFGPSTIRRVRSITQDGTASSSTIAGLSNDELLSEHDRLVAELSELRGEFKRQEHVLTRRLRALRLELRVRGLSSK
jgi:hypothetical protein